MCGRYVVIATYEQIEVRFYVKTREVREVFLPNYNVGVDNFAPVVTCDKPTELQWFQFGMRPAWNKKLRLINARTEGKRNETNDVRYSGAKDIINMPAFRQAIRQRRCLVIANGFYEGPEKEKLSKPYLFYLTGQKLFAMAGIYETWVDEETGEVVNSFAIITTVSNRATQLMGHHRSPVILSEKDERTWLNANAPLHDITQLLEPYNYKDLNGYPVNPAMKSPKATGAQLIEPTGPLLIPEEDFNITYKRVYKNKKDRDDSQKLTLGEQAELRRQEDSKNKK